MCVYVCIRGGNMTRPGFMSCVEVLKWLQLNGFEKEVDIKNLRRAIEINVGTSDAVIQKYLRLLQDFEMIKKAGNGVFEINYKRIAELGREA